MKKLLCIMFVVALCTPCLSQMIGGDLKPVDLPEDGGVWHLSVIGQLDGPECREVIDWMSTNRYLTSFRRQVHWHTISPDTAIFKERVKDTIAGVPAIRLQDSKGRIVYESKLSEIPYTSDGLYKALYNSVERYKKMSGCPLRPHRPDDTKPPVIRPDIPPVVPEPENHFGDKERLAVLLCAVCGILGFGVAWYKHYNTKKK